MGLGRNKGKSQSPPEKAQPSKQASSMQPSSKQTGDKQPSTGQVSCKQVVSRPSEESRLFGNAAAQAWPLSVDYNPDSWHWAPEKSTTRLYQPGPEDYRDLRLCVAGIESWAEDLLDNLVFDVLQSLLDGACSILVGIATCFLLTSLFFIMLGATGIMVFIVAFFGFIKYLVEGGRKINSFFNPWNTRRRVPAVETVSNRKCHGE